MRNLLVSLDQIDVSYFFSDKKIRPCIIFPKAENFNSMSACPVILRIQHMPSVLFQAMQAAVVWVNIARVTQVPELSWVDLFRIIEDFHAPRVSIPSAFNGTRNNVRACVRPK